MVNPGNLVLDYLTIPWLIFFFIPITCLLDSVGRNSVLVTYSLSCSLERYYEGRSRLLHKNTSQWPFHSGMNSTIFPRMLILRIWYWIKWSSCWWYLSWILITKFAWYCIDFGRRNYILVIPDYNTSWSPCIFYWQAKYSLKSCSMYLKISRKKAYSMAN